MSAWKDHFAVAVTSPEGLTRYVGYDLWWVDQLGYSSHIAFDTAEDAQAHIDNPWTNANGRKAAGWKVEVISVAAIPFVNPEL